MKRAINIVSLFLFIQFFLSHTLSLLPDSRIYVSLTLLLPLLLFFLPLLRDMPKAELGVGLKGIFPYLWLFPLFEIAVMLTSLATGIASSIVGYVPSPVVPEGSIVEIMIFSVLLPAICEEALCRFAILRLLAPHGAKGAIVVSALFFALMHGNFYQMPYAFIAGLALGALTLSSRSVMLAVIFHALNNLLSVILYYSGERGSLIIVCVLIALSLVGFVACKRNGVFSRLRNTFSQGSAIPMLSSAVGSLALLYMVIMIISSV